jgi:hypothetical protein
MKLSPYLIQLATLLCCASRADEVIPRICWFDPPPHVESYGERNDPGDNPFDMRSKAVTFQPQGVRQSDFRALAICTRLVGASIGEGKVVSINPISDEQLKSAMAAEIVPGGPTNLTQVEETKLAGQRALKIHRATTMLTETYWVRVRPNQVLEVSLFGANEALLASIRPWLSSLKINVSDKPDPLPPLPLAKNGMQLGLTEEQMRERCGEPCQFSGPNETYVTDRYLVTVFYHDTADLIAYAKVRDPQKAGRALNQKEVLAQLLPMTSAEAETLLQGQRGTESLNWSRVGEDQWKRTDGAMARLYENSLTLATADMWPKIEFSKPQKQP